MNIPDAVTALRTLDALAEPRRRYLAVLAATAPTDAERSLLVLDAKQEDRRVRVNLDADLKREMQSRRVRARHSAERPAESRQKPVQRMTRTDETVPTARPVSIRFVEPTKTATTPRPVHRPMFAPKPKPEAEPVQVEPEKPEIVNPRTGKPIEHGRLVSYNEFGCRCDLCRAKKSESRKRVGRVRRANGEPAPCGTTTSYARGCRCQSCRDAVAAHARKKYHEKRARNIE